MAKKKRSGGATAASSGSSTPASRAPATRDLLPSVPFRPVDVEKSAASRHYEELLADPVHTPWTLDRSLWLHSVVAMFVHSALIYDEDLLGEEMALFAWTALWMGRPVLLSAFLPEPNLNSSWKRLVGWRVALAVGLLGEHVVRLIRQSDESVALETIVIVLLLLLLESLATWSCWKTKASSSVSQLVLSSIELPFLVLAFSRQINRREFLIYDQKAVALVGVTVFIQTVSLLSAKYLLLTGSGEDSAQVALDQERRKNLLQGLRQSMETFGASLTLPVAKSPRRKRHQKANKLRNEEQSSSASALTTDGRTPTPVERWMTAPSRRRLLLGIVLAQVFLLTTQVILSAGFLLSWEIISVLMLSSSHVLWLLLQVYIKAVQRFPMDLHVDPAVALDLNAEQRQDNHSP